jgi:putative tricarboxylic transport membrane protein
LAVRAGAHNRQDILAGLAFLTIALLGLWIARNYPIGTPGRMAKGFMPAVLCVILAGLGVATIVRGVLSSHAERVTIAWRPLVLVVTGFAAFGLTLNTLGFVLASAAMLVIGSFALPRRHLLETALTVAVLIAGCALLFVVGLKLPIPIWPQL